MSAPSVGPTPLIRSVVLIAGFLNVGSGVSAAPQAAETFGVASRSVILTVHAEGAQIYECQTKANGRAAWTFREPIATLVLDGKTMGRHYAGPNWDLIDGSGLKAKPSASAPGAGPQDVALLKLDVVEHRGQGMLSDVTTVLRLDTRGGDLKGPCDTVGAFRAEPYSADYSFLR